MSPCEPRGRAFESLRAHQQINGLLVNSGKPFFFLRFMGKPENCQALKKASAFPVAAHQLHKALSSAMTQLSDMLRSDFI